MGVQMWNFTSNIDKSSCTRTEKQGDLWSSGILWQVQELPLCTATMAHWCNQSNKTQQSNKENLVLITPPPQHSWALSKHLSLHKDAFEITFEHHSRKGDQSELFVPLPVSGNVKREVHCRPGVQSWLSISHWGLSPKTDYTKVPSTPATGRKEEEFSKGHYHLLHTRLLPRKSCAVSNLGAFQNTSG